MSGYVLCQIRQAETPLYVPEIDLHLYSIEELCYFCCNNLALLDENFFSDSLAGWLEKELGLARLAARLRSEAAHPFRLEHYLIPILTEISWLDKKEMVRLTDRIHMQEELPEAARRKEKADTMFRHNRIMLAAETYQEILTAGAASGGMGTQFTGTVRHNLGVAYARLFELEEAEKCLKQAYDLLHSQNTLRDYLYCVWLKDGSAAYAARCAELGVDSRTREEMDAELAAFRADAPAEDTGEQLRGWVEDYHSAAGM